MSAENKRSFLFAKKVLLVGLGRLGGGVSMAKFLIKKGAKLIATDLNSSKELSKSLSQLKRFNITFHLGGHKESDFKNSEIIVFNPAVSFFSSWVKLAQKFKKAFFNDYTLFLKLLFEKSPEKDFIGITGTRGKTTVTSWIGHLLFPSVIGGNIPQNGLLKIIKKVKRNIPLVLELSSYQLEYLSYFNKGNKYFLKDQFLKPRIAVITNLSPDHLNRYKTMKRYLEVKSKIFQFQTKDDFLVLNYLDEYTPKFLLKKPKSQIYYFSLKPLPKSKNGLFFEKNKVFFQKNGGKTLVSTFKDLSNHQKNNLLASMLTAYLYQQLLFYPALFGKKKEKSIWKEIVLKTRNLPNVIFRQQIVFKRKNLIIVNDSASTSPEGVIAAIERFSRNSNFILITGGTDKNLDFKKLALYIRKNLQPNQIFFLKGSATQKLIDCLSENGFLKEKINPFSSLKEIMELLKNKKRGVIVFSPGSASFEMFKNEFDRGYKFNKLVKKYFI